MYFLVPNRDPPILVFFFFFFSISLLFLSFPIILAFLDPFLFSKDFRGSAKRKALAFFRGFACTFFCSKKQGLKSQGMQNKVVGALRGTSGLEVLISLVGAATSRKKWPQNAKKMGR